MHRLRRNNKVSIPSLDSLEDNTEEDEVCTPSNCVSESNEDVLTCKKCKRTVHYSCSELPAYFIHLLITTSKQEKKDKVHPFVCRNCVNIPKDLADKIKSTNQLQRDITNCENIMKQNEEDKKELESKFRKVQGELKDLKGKLKKDPAMHTIEYLESKFEEKVTKMGMEIKESIMEEIKAIKVVSTNENKQSYAGVAAINNDDAIKSIVVKARKQELAEDHDKKRRETNMIIHGVPEPNGDDDTTPTEKDLEFVDTLIKDMHIRVPLKNVVKVVRIGKKSDEKTRPLKVVMSELKWKDTIFNNLCNLKSFAKYKGVGITDDYTAAERELLKEWVERAKTRNEEETDETVIWRVRGSPKNRLQLKKFPRKKKEEHQEKDQDQQEKK